MKKRNKIAEQQELRVCKRCGETKPLRDFGLTGGEKKWRKHTCKACAAKEKREAYIPVPDGLRRGRGGRAIMKEGRTSKLYWGEIKVEDFKRKYPFNLNADLAIDFDCSVRTITRRAREMGLMKNPEWMRGIIMERVSMAHFANTLPSTRKADLTNFKEASKQFRFAKGHDPWGTHEQRSERARRAAETRRRNKAKAERKRKMEEKQ